MIQDWERFSIQSLAEGRGDERGRLFLSSSGQVNLDRVRILHAGIDTVKQTYTGLPCQAEFDRLREAYVQGSGATIHLGGHDWLVGAVGIDSGYRYKLQNNDLGAIVLFRSRHHKIDAIAPHLKIELSPHLIHEQGAEGSQRFMDNIAKHLLAKLEHQSCAVHLALDVQGWRPGRDFLQRFTSRSRTIYTADGIDRANLDQGSIAVGYGDLETITFGRPSSLQFTTYNKTKEAATRDKLDFWRGIWNSAPGDDPTESPYDPDQDVQRLEARFHQSVLSDYARGIPCDVDTGECLDSSHGFKRG